MGRTRETAGAGMDGQLRTVKEVSDLTGVSVRTLHYYDEIDLLKPSCVGENGYRLYGEDKLEELRQILFFRELSLPLGEIRRILADPALDPERILEGQRQALDARKRHLERLIASIDQIRRGDKKMDFEVFERDDVEKLFDVFAGNMPEAMWETAVQEFGSMEAFRRNYVEKAFTLYNQPETKEILLESYGDKQGVIDAAVNPPGKEGVEKLQRQTDAVCRRLAQCKREGLSETSLEAQMLVCEYALAMKTALRLKNERQVMLGTADTYDNYEKASQVLDEQYGEPGLAAYLSRAIRNFYR